MTDTRNMSLQKKTSARMAAIQCLYRLKMISDQPPIDKLIEDVLTSSGEGESDLPAPDKAFLRKLLVGIQPELATLTPEIEKRLTPGWKLERLGVLMLSLLQAAAYEIKHHTTLHTGIIIDEYASLAHGFFEESEVNFVHGILHALAKELRP